MYHGLNAYLQICAERFDQISEKRKVLLEVLAKKIVNQLNEGGPSRLTFICTHNSRRSHFGQIWAQTAARYFKVDPIETYSGGTEATAFNPSAVAALKDAGFVIEQLDASENPKYEVMDGPNSAKMICYSKVYDAPVNPSKDFIAVMTCSEADENCPLVLGASARFALTYDDPKLSDGTPEQAATYQDRCREIAIEMCYMFHQVKQQIS